jgi:hypothetical protein
VQPLPRPSASVPLGGSLRASRAAQLAAPQGPLAAIDFADGRALMAELRGTLWVEVDEGEANLLRPAPLPHAPLAAAAPRRRRRLGTLLALAAALGAAAVGLAPGLSGSPAPAVAGPIARPGGPLRAEPRRPAAPVARGGRAAAVQPRRAAVAHAPSAVRPAPAPAAVVTAPPRAPPPPAAPAPLPELPAAPAL